MSKAFRIIAATALLLGACSTGDAVTTTTVAVVAPSTTTAVETSTTAVESTTTVDSAPPADAATPPPSTPDLFRVTISYSGGDVTGGGRIEVPLGEPVQLLIESDTADEAHLHGYDIFLDLEPGTDGIIEFTADIPGIFELELENSRVLLAELEVGP
jgi:hypothetical protein